MTRSNVLCIDKGIAGWLKVIAALAVALHHYSQYAVSQLGDTHLVFRIFSYLGGYCGVALFFFLSGFGLMESESSKHLTIQQFMKRRFLKIYLPVVLVTGIWLCIIGLLPFDVSRSSCNAGGGFS